MEKKLILWMFDWRKREDGKLVGSGVFPWPTKILSPKFEEKMEGREIVADNN